MKHKQACPGFELESRNLFPMRISIIPSKLAIVVCACDIYIYIYIYDNFKQKDGEMSIRNTKSIYKRATITWINKKMEAVEDHDCPSRQGKTSSTSVLDLTLNHLITRLQPWRFGECGLPLHCYWSRVHSDLER